MKRKRLGVTELLITKTTGDKKADRARKTELDNASY
jgi:hypothetical protein